MKVLFTKESPPVTLDYAISRYHTEIDQSLELTRSIQFGISLFTKDNHLESLVCENGNSIHAIAVAHYVCLHSKNYSYPLIDQNDESVLLNKEIAEKIIEKLGAIEPSTKEDQPLSIYLGIRILNSILQNNFTYEMASTAILTGIESFQNISKLDNDQFYKAFEENIGVSPKKYLETLLALWSVAQIDIFINKKTFLQNSTDTSVTKNDLEIMLEELSITIPFNPSDSKYAFHLQAREQDKAISLFMRFPLIKISDNHFLITSHKFLEAHLLSKLFNKIRLFSDSFKDSHPLSKIIPKRFEDFIAEMFLQANFTLEKEYKYLKHSSEQTARSPDLIIFEKHGSDEVCTLIQVKLKMPTEELLHPKEDNKVRKSLIEYSTFIERSLNYFQKAQTAQRENNLADNTKDISLRILKCKKIFLLGVAPQVPDLFCSLITRKDLLNQITQSFDASFLDNFIKNKNNHGRLYWHIIGLNELQTFLALPAKQRRLFCSLEKYLEKEKVDSIDIISKEKGLSDNFKSFLINKYQQGSMKTKLQSLHDTSNRIFKNTIQYFKLTNPPQD